MTSIGELFPKCRKLAYDARQQLAVVQQGQLSVSELYLVLEELNRQLDTMDELALRETPAQRTVWKAKISELRQESASLQQQGTMCGYTNTPRTMYQSQREELMLRRRKRRDDDEGEMQNFAAEAQSLDQSNFMVNDIIRSGEASLNNLMEQRQRLRGVTRVLADIGDRLGLSQATMRIIERRDITDAYLVAAGMVVTIIVIYFTWF
jgi:Golgi SNAP receptor complex protein 2